MLKVFGNKNQGKIKLIKNAEMNEIISYMRTCLAVNVAVPISSYGSRPPRPPISDINALINKLKDRTYKGM